MSSGIYESLSKLVTHSSGGIDVPRFTWVIMLAYYQVTIIKLKLDCHFINQVVIKCHCLKAMCLIIHVSNTLKIKNKYCQQQDGPGLNE